MIGLVLGAGILGFALGMRSIGFTLKRRLTPAQRKELAGWLDAGAARELGDQVR